MLIAYIIVLLIAISFKILHFPWTIWIFFSSPLFPFVDIIIQLVRKKGDKETRLLSSIGVFLLSLFLMFKFSYWSGDYLFFWIAITVLSVFIFRFLQKKINYNVRFFLTGLLFIFAIFNFSIKDSDFRLTYSLEDPFDPSENVPHFFLQSLAYEYYLEEDYGKAEKLIQQNINHITDLLNEQDVLPRTHTRDSLNLEISIQDLKDIRNRSWTNSCELGRVDRIKP